MFLSRANFSEFKVNVRQKLNDMNVVSSYVGGKFRRGFNRGIKWAKRRYQIISWGEQSTLQFKIEAKLVMIA